MKKPKLSRRAFVGLGSLAALGALTGRVAYVNATAVPEPEVIGHAMGEWVELDGAFIELSDLEQTAGYAMRVSEAQVLSPREYVERYTVTSEVDVGGYDGDIAACDVSSLVCLTIDIRNDGSQGQLCFADMCLVAGGRKNEDFLPATELFISSEEQYAASGANFASAFFAVRPGTEYTIHMPYTHGSLRGTDWVPYDSVYHNPVNDRAFDMVLSFVPVRHVVSIEL
jgi:hypothetical protein